jgi:hypothetical protein
LYELKTNGEKIEIPFLLPREKKLTAKEVWEIKTWAGRSTTDLLLQQEIYTDFDEEDEVPEEEADDHVPESLP